MNHFKILTITTVLLLSGVGMAGCGSDVPDVSDEQLLSFLGTKNVWESDDAPLTIAERTEECAELLSGLNADVYADVYKDMPSDIKGMYKTDCRENFQKLINDKSKNTYGFTLASFEDKKLAKRIVRVSQEAREKQQRRLWAKAKAAKEEAEQKRSAYINAFQIFVNELDTKLAALPNRCRMLEEKRQMTRNTRSQSISWVYDMPSFCKMPTENIKQQALHNLEKIQGTTISCSGTLWQFIPPSLYPNKVSPKWWNDEEEKFQQYEERLDKDLQ